jgi:hypothetical protein
MLRRWNTGSWSSGTWNEVLPDPQIIIHMKSVSLKLSRKSKAETLQLVQNIITGATGNPDFGTPNPPLADLQLLFDEGTECVNELELASNALTLKRSMCDEKFIEIRTAITLFAIWAVQKVAGDRVKLESVGLEVRPDKSPVGPLPAPANLQSFTGELEGTVGLQWDPVYGRTNYHAEYSTTANGPWTQFYTSRASQATCVGLTPGAEYFFRVNAQGRAGQGPWSDITKKRAA